MSLSTVCIAAFPLSPGATTTYGPVGNSAASFTAPIPAGTLTVNGATITVRPYSMGAGDIVEALVVAGLTGASMSLLGFLVVPDGASISGNATILSCLGLTAH